MNWLNDKGVKEEKKEVEVKLFFFVVIYILFILILIGIIKLYFFICLI